ncbi:MAG TPA: hypothetical protein VN929_09015 [Burkholderiales bacterium]|nr:hypothetical protein [Burkholderiales bacterium]
MSAQHAVALQTFGNNSDFVDAIIKQDVRVIVVGGLAVHHYCPSRTADDLDLLVEPATHAGGAIASVLYRFNDVASFSPEDFARPRQHYRQRRALYLDLLTPHPEDDFNAFWERAPIAILNGVRVRVVALDDLLLLKERALRERGDQKDRRDVELLQTVAV